MANFESAIKFVLSNEGGLSEVADDPGGITNFGISLRFLREVAPDVLKKAGIFEVVDENTIRNLTVDQATILYREEFWEKAQFLKLNNQILCNYIFDMCVNHGIAQGIKLAQRAVCACQKKMDFLADDGIMGSKTIAGINYAGFLLQYAMIAERAGFVRLLVCQLPRLEKFLHGWLERCYKI